jgi:PPM family protein phosphatase
MSVFRRLFSRQENSPPVVHTNQESPALGEFIGDDATSSDNAAVVLPEDGDATHPSSGDDEQAISLPDTPAPGSSGTMVMDPAITNILPDVEAPTGQDDVKASRGRLAYAQASHTGLVRSNNQDSVASAVILTDTSDQTPDLGVFIVADGMGGHLDGEKASAIVIHKVMHHVMTRVFLPLLNHTDDNRQPIGEALIEAAREANADVLRELNDGGTTLTMAIIIDDLAHLVHVGDSRAYLFDNGDLEQISRDHSLVQRLIELGQLDPEEAENHPQRNVLYRAVGQSDTIEVDSITRRLHAGEKLLLCTDGLWGIVDHAAIASELASDRNLQVICDNLVRMANDAGGHDNISAIVVGVPAGN